MEIDYDKYKSLIKGLSEEKEKKLPPEPAKAPEAAMEETPKHRKYMSVEDNKRFKEAYNEWVMECQDKHNLEYYQDQSLDSIREKMNTMYGEYRIFLAPKIHAYIKEKGIPYRWPTLTPVKRVTLKGQDYIFPFFFPAKLFQADHRKNTDKDISGGYVFPAHLTPKAPPAGDYYPYYQDEEYKKLNQERIALEQHASALEGKYNSARYTASKSGNLIWLLIKAALIIGLILVAGSVVWGICALPTFLFNDQRKALEIYTTIFLFPWGATFLWALYKWVIEPQKECLDAAKAAKRLGPELSAARKKAREFVESPAFMNAKARNKQRTDAEQALVDEWMQEWYDDLWSANWYFIHRSLYSCGYFLSALPPRLAMTTVLRHRAEKGRL